MKKLLLIVILCSSLFAHADTAPKEKRTRWEKKEDRFYKRFNKRFDSVQKAIGDWAQYYSTDELKQIVSEEIRYLRAAEQNDVADNVENYLEKNIDDFHMAMAMMATESTRQTMLQAVEANIKATGGFKKFFKKHKIRSCRIKRVGASVLMVPTTLVMIYSGLALGSGIYGGIFLTLKGAAVLATNAAIAAGTDLFLFPALIDEIFTDCYLYPNSLLK